LYSQAGHIARWIRKAHLTFTICNTHCSSTATTVARTLLNISLHVHCAALLVGRSRDRFPVVSLGIFSEVPPTEPCALRSAQPLKLSSRRRPVRLADDLPPPS